MSITAWDIKEAAFASDTNDVEELILANKGTTDVGALSQAVNLRSLSLAFNCLTGLAGLAPLTRLQSLNVSHNQLASLKGLQGLSCLVSLNVSYNKVASLGPLSGLSALADVWLQNNAVAAPAELRVLAGLPALQRLAIANNPVVKALPADHVRLVALGLCPGLRLMDGRPVESAEREASNALDFEALLAARPAAPGSAPAATHAPGSPGFLDGRPGPSGRTAAPHSSGSDGASSRVGRSGPAGRRPSNGASGLRTPDSRLPAAGARRPARSSSYDAMPETSSPTLISLHRTREPPGTSGLSSSAADDGSDGDDAASPLPLEPMASFSSTTSASSSRTGTATGTGTGAGTGTQRSGAGRRPPLPGGVRPASQLQQGSQFQAVLDALPRFDAAKLPKRYNGAPPRLRGAGGASAAPPAPAARPPPDAHVVEHEAKYPVQRGGGRAVVVRRDGSAAAFWPGGDMAVTVDADYSSPAPPAPDDPRVGPDGCDTAPAPPRCSYKMMVMYRAGGVAVSWDAQGGFVQYPSGGLMLMYSRVTGSGTCYSPSGDITRRWHDPDAPAAAPPPSIALPFPLAAPHSPPPPPPPPPSHIDMQLDPHLGVRFLASTRSIELYLSCEGVRYRLRCGRNTPGEAWEPPPGRGDSAAGGGGGGGGTSWPKLAAQHQQQQQQHHGSQPGTPSGSAAQTERPVVCDAAGAEAGGPGQGESLPPPSFLRNLARQGGAGTHKAQHSGAASRQGQAAGSPSASPASATSRPPADEVDVGGIASITAGLQALTEGLQAMLTRDTREPAAASAGAAESPRSSPAAAASPAPKLSPAKGRRGSVAGSGVSAVRALAAEAEAAGSAADADADGRVTRGSILSSRSARQRSAPADDLSQPSSSLSDSDGAAGRREAQAAAAVSRPAQQELYTSVRGQGSGNGPTAGWLWSATTGGPGPPGDGEGVSGVAASEAQPPSLASATGHSGEGGQAEGVDAGEGEVQRRGLDSDVAAQLAAARKLAADSLAAAMAAASAAAAVGTQG